MINFTVNNNKHKIFWRENKIIKIITRTKNYIITKKEIKMKRRNERKRKLEEGEKESIETETKKKSYIDIFWYK